MVNAGKAAVKVLSDGWTAVTVDRSLSAHFEHTVVVTRSGAEILTLLSDDVARVRGLAPEGLFLGAGRDSHETMSAPARS
jgi:methionyl aminopeptidase